MADTTLGRARPPDPDLAPESLKTGDARPPDPEDPFADEVFEQRGGVLDFESDSDTADRTVSRTTSLGIAAALIISAAAGYAGLRRRRRNLYSAE